MLGTGWEYNERKQHEEPTDNRPECHECGSATWMLNECEHCHRELCGRCDKGKHFTSETTSGWECAACQEPTSITKGLAMTNHRFCSVRNGLTELIDSVGPADTMLCVWGAIREKFPGDGDHMFRCEIGDHLDAIQKMIEGKLASMDEIR